MRVVKIFLILLLVSSNTLYAQHRGQQRSMLEGMVKSSENCTPLSEEEIERINTNIERLLDSIHQERMENLPQPAPKDERFIFSDDLRVQFRLKKKYDAYNDVRYGDAWRSTPYGELITENETPADKLDEKELTVEEESTITEINNEVNTLLEETYKELKQNPFYKSDNFGSYCGDVGTYALIFATFIVIGEYVAAEATTVTGYSFLSGLAWNFRTLFSSPAFLTNTTNFGRIGSTLIGFGISLPLLDKYTKLIKNAFNIPDDEKNAVGTQRDLHRALKQKFDLNEQVKEIINDKTITTKQKRTRIDIRYREAIIKIYALDYIKDYLTYGEKSEKYFWALLDLTTLLQSRDFVNYADFQGGAIEVEPLPRLAERTPQLQTLLENLTSIHMQGYGYNPLIPSRVQEYWSERYSNHLQKKVEERAIKNQENLDYNFDF